MSTTALPVVAREETPFRRFVAEFAASRVALAALVLFVLIGLAAIFAPFIVPQNPYDLAQLDIMDGRLPPGSASAAGYIPSISPVRRSTWAAPGSTIPSAIH